MATADQVRIAVATASLGRQLAVLAADPDAPSIEALIEQLAYVARESHREAVEALAAFDAFYVVGELTYDADTDTLGGAR